MYCKGAEEEDLEDLQGKCISTRSENLRFVFKLENRSKDILGKANRSARDKLCCGNNPKFIVAHNTAPIMVWL